jgi:hypothetical protein
MRISIEQYVAVENPRAASQMLTKYGIPPATSLKDLAEKMEVVTYKYRALAFADLAAIDTPYRRLIMDSVNTEVAVATLLPENVSNCDGGCSCKSKVEEKSNCTGCGGTCGGKKSNVEGDNSAPKIEKREVVLEDKSSNSKSSTESMDKYMMPTLAIVAIAALIIIAKK